MGEKEKPNVYGVEMQPLRGFHSFQINIEKKKQSLLIAYKNLLKN